MFVKLTSGFTGAVLLFRKLVLRDFWRTGSKSCKPEVTFAIYPPNFSNYLKYNTKKTLSQELVKVSHMEQKAAGAKAPAVQLIHLVLYSIP